ncbi:MAG: glycosyltransferase family 9 protein [Ignavibacteriales bacterium]|nr:glycosyltransferase family 9 protein [Ignavibacteriales bacterium]
MDNSKPLTKIDFSSIKKILIVRLGKIGDLVVTSFVFEVLKKKYPHLEIHLLTLTSNQDVLKYNPRLSKVIYTKKNLSLYLKLNALRKESYDMILDFNDNPSTTSAVIFKFVNARIKAGYNFSKYERYINFKVTPLKKENSHIIERMNNFLFQLGIEADEKLVKPFFYLGSEELGEVEFELSFIEKSKNLIAVNLSAGAEIRYWDTEKWNLLLHSINDAYKNCFFLLLSSEKDRMLQRQLVSSLGTEKCIEAKLASIQHFAAYIKSADLLITPDTSAVHIASGFGIPTLALYPNPNWNYISWQPYRIAHRSIKSSTENINDISVQEVFIKFKSLINEIGIT